VVAEIEKRQKAGQPVLVGTTDIDKSEALSEMLTRKGVAHDIAKVLRSAVSNAQQQEGASGDTERLVVGECYANQGPTLKRIRAAPMGRAFQIKKRTSHLTVTVRERPEVATRVQVAGSVETE